MRKEDINVRESSGGLHRAGAALLLCCALFCVVPGSVSAGAIVTPEDGTEREDSTAVDRVEPGDEGKGEKPSEEADYPKFTPEEYTFAGAPRYTVLGEMPYRKTHIRPIPAIITGTTVAAMIASIHFYQQGAWWSEGRREFHFQTDWYYAAQADKVGHFYAGWITSYIGHEMLVASGFSPSTAGWLAPLLAMGFQTYVEIEDGYSPFGFDPTDQVANVLGPLFFGLRNYVKPLQNVGFKWSYWPNSDYLTGVRYGHEKIVVDDYNGQQIWLSLKMENILPDDFPWPAWLRLAAGYGAANVDRWDENGDLQVPVRRFFVALDYDLVEMIPDIGWFGNWMKQSLDNFRLPAPALQIEPELKFYLLWPVRI